MPDRICPCGTRIPGHAHGNRKHCSSCQPSRERVNPKPLKPLKLKACEVCGENFYTKHATAKYCGRSCAWRPCEQCGCPTGWKISDNRPRTSEYLCMPCKKVRTASKPKRKCSISDCDRDVLGRGLCPSHYSAWHRNQRKYSIVCAYCAKTTTVDRKRNKHCSYECAMKAVAHQKLVANAAKAGVPLEQWVEDRPYRNGRLTRHQRGQRKLDKAAKGTAGRTIWVDRSCKVCSNHFLTQSSATGTCCSAICTAANKRSKRVDAGARRRARKRGAYVRPVKRLAIFKRDKYRCHICKKLTNPKKCVPHPKAPTIDHIIPLAKGGTHEPANVATSCFQCNCLKRDEGGGEQLALLG